MEPRPRWLLLQTKPAGKITPILLLLSQEYSPSTPTTKLPAN